MFLPSAHGGHSILDNHHKMGLNNKGYDGQLFRPDNCSNCKAFKWCYGVERFTPATGNGLGILYTLYKCYVETAQSRKVAPITLTLHAPPPVSFQEFLVDRYKVNSYEQVYFTSNSDGLLMFLLATEFCMDDFDPDKILRAVEFDFLPDLFQNEVNNLIDRMMYKNPSVLIIGSVHFIDTVEGIIWYGNTVNKNERELTKKYFLEVGIEKYWIKILQTYLDMIKSDRIDLVGHLFVGELSFDKCPMSDPIKNIVAEIIKAAKFYNTVFEICTAGFEKGIHKDDPLFPAEWLRFFADRGAKLTISDDSHNQTQIGRYYPESIKFLEDNSVRSIWVPTGKRNPSNEYIWKELKII